MVRFLMHWEDERVRRRWARKPGGVSAGCAFALALVIASAAIAQPPSGAAPPASGTAGDAVGMLVAAEQAVQTAIERTAPSVVAIARVRRGERRDAAAQFNFNLPGIQRPLVESLRPEVVPTEFGSGVILSDDGAILTCYHVVDAPAENDYYVWIAPRDGVVGDGNPLPARVQPLAGRVRAGDPWTDLAVIQVDAEGLPPMPMGDASQLRRGSFVVSLGNPYATARDGRASASWGIVSNLQRSAPPANEDSGNITPPEALQEFGTLIQTDARLNLGSSGGALVNLRGEMIGLTTSLAAVAGYEQAAGYAIPIDRPTLSTIAQLREGRTPAFGFLGVEPIDLEGNRGALVRRVVPGMPADRARIRAGDVIVAVDGQRIADAQALFREMSRRGADAEVQMTVVSSADGNQRTVTARLGKKRLALSRPGYSEVPEPSWRGMQVDFASALPPERLLRSGLGSQGETAVLRVDPDSAAWRAGVRPGQLVIEAAGKAVDRPEDFFQAVEGKKGQVELKLEDRIGSVDTVVVDPS